jgi:hypothetical protein
MASSISSSSLDDWPQRTDRRSGREEEEEDRSWLPARLDPRCPLKCEQTRELIGAKRKRTRRVHTNRQCWEATQRSVEEKLFFLLASLRLLLKRDKSQRGWPLEAACFLHLVSQGRGSSCSAHHAIYQAFELHAAEPLYIQVADSDTIHDVNVCVYRSIITLFCTVSCYQLLNRCCDQSVCLSLFFSWEESPFVYLAASPRREPYTLYLLVWCVRACAPRFRFSTNVYILHGQTKHCCSPSCSR